MAEIKSTLEIALEKASRLEMDEGEEKELRLKTQMEAVLGELRLKPSGEPDKKRLREALSKVPKDLASEVREGLLKNLLSRLELSQEDLGVIKLAKEVASEEKAGRLEGLLKLVKKSLKKLKELKSGTDHLVKERLKAKGVRGSAVVIPHGDSPGYHEELERLFRELKSEVQKIVQV